MSSDFTPSVLDRLAAGKSIKEKRTKGLIASAGKDRRVTWRYERRTKVEAGSEKIKRTLGGYPAFNIVEARKWADELNHTIDRGENPNAIRDATKAAAVVQATRDAMTVQAAYDLWIVEKALKDSPATHRNRKGRFERDILPAIGAKPITDVTHDDLWEIVETKKEEGAGVASNRLVNELKVFFKWCVSVARTKTGLRYNPAADLIKLEEESARTRTFSDAELRLFIRAVALDTSDVTRRLFPLLLLSGQRLTNCLWASPRQWNAEHDAWEIERTKNKDPNLVPLAAWGKSLFETEGKWVFPSVRGDGPRVGHIRPLYVEVAKTMQELAGDDFVIEHWTAHDLRRVIRTHMAGLGVDEEIAERIIAHAQSGISRVYNRYAYIKEKRAALALWEAKIVRIAIEENVADALNIPAAARPEIALKAA